MRVVLALILGATTLACGRPPTLEHGRQDARGAPVATRDALRQWHQRLASATGLTARVAIARELWRVARDADDPQHVVRELHRATPVASAETYKALLRLIGAAVPDPSGRFPTAAAPAPRPDWLLRLLRHASSGSSGAGARAVAVEAAYSVALARGLAARRRAVGAEARLVFAYVHGGALRDECGALLRAMGEAAVPTLVRAGQLRHPLAYRMARYAEYQLDRLDRSRPDLALQVDAPRLRAELLRAYGSVRHPAAVGEVLRLTAATHPVVRDAARWAVLRYVSAPVAAAGPPRRRLRLPGGQTSADEQDLYLDAGELMRRAVAARNAALAPALTRPTTADPRQQAWRCSRPRTWAAGGGARRVRGGPRARSAPGARRWPRPSSRRSSRVTDRRRPLPIRRPSASSAPPSPGSSSGAVIPPRPSPPAAWPCARFPLAAPGAVPSWTRCVSRPRPPAMAPSARSAPGAGARR
ncbi:MAG: hypothetical protein IPG96_14400 [Proteobacteria bacterium]|nr:hypothetical protein [Pseudomonadota bacterium]